MKKLSEMSCVWWEEEEQHWHTECDNDFYIVDGSPHGNDMQFCPFCGKLLAEME